MVGNPTTMQLSQSWPQPCGSPLGTVPQRTSPKEISRLCQHWAGRDRSSLAMALSLRTAVHDKAAHETLDTDTAVQLMEKVTPNLRRQLSVHLTQKKKKTKQTFLTNVPKCIVSILGLLSFFFWGGYFPWLGKSG